jgi:S1-C subfamily serine protease
MSTLKAKASTSTSNVTLFATKLTDLRSAKQEWSKRLLHAPRPEAFRSFAAASSVAPDQNVVGVGVGEQIVDDKPTGVMAVKFFVRVKYPEHELSKATLLPKSIAGLPVDVEETGLFRRFAPAMPNPKTKIRPAQPGCSVGYKDPNNQIVMAGTFGAVVKDHAGQYVLSNNHVLADENRLPVGAPIFQPGLLDGGNANTDQIAALTRFIALSAAGNKVDCAIAKVTSNNLVSKDVLHIGAPTGTADAAIDMAVHKFGRTTSYTVGQVKSIDTDVTVGYETGNYTFHEQIIIVGGSGHPFSAAGDSGSLILQRGTNKAVGLLFAGSNTHTIANHISDVLQALKVTLA